MPIFLSLDAYLSTDEARGVVAGEYAGEKAPAARQLEPAPGTLRLEPLRADELHAMAQQADDVLHGVMARARVLLVSSDFELIRQLRCRRRLSWREVARACHEHLRWAFWSPPTNQLAGMALCGLAAEFYDEDPSDAPWAPPPPPGQSGFTHEVPL